MKLFFASLGKRRRYVVTELFLVYLVLGVALILLGSILPDLRQAYGLDYKTGGTLISIQSVGYLVIGLFTGVLSMQAGQKRAYLLLYALLPVGLIMLLVNGAPLWLMAAMLLIGFAKGAITDYNNRIMSAYAKGSAAPLNLLHAFFAIGACLAPVLALACLSCGTGGWRIALFISTALVLAALVFGAFMNLSGDAHEVPADATPNGGFGFLQERLFWQTTAIAFFYQAVEASMMGWLTSFYIDSGVMGESSAQLVTSVLWVSLLVGRFSCSAIATRFRPYQMILVMCVGIAGFLALLVCGSSLPVLLAATVGLGLCMSGMYGTSVSNAGDLFARYPVCMGLFVTLTGVGGAAAPAAVGAVADRLDLRHGFAVLLIAAILLVAAAVVNTLYFRKKKA